MYKLVGLLVIVFAIGWVVNLVKFATVCDFDNQKSSYHCEVVRGLGVIVPPIGGVVGFIPLGE